MSPLTITLVFVCQFWIFTHGAEIVVSTPVGNIKGLSDTISFNGRSYSYKKFLGIPYAESTEGYRRFEKPVKKEPFTDTFDATAEKLACVQNPYWSEVVIPSTEDCLTLNIFVPENATAATPKPVMLYIYGGGFQQGYQSTYGIGALPVVNDVVYVTINYRVTVFGFLSHSKYGLKGNYGLWDQHMAIQWVHDNIASFGGDPNHVTLFGESAGSASVMYQALYAGNAGLFQRIICESGAVGAIWSYTKSNDDLADEIVRNIDCEADNAQDIVDCLQTKTTDAITGVIPGDYTSMFSPLYDGEFITYDLSQLYNTTIPSSANALARLASYDAIIGINSNESSLEMYYAFVLGIMGYNITYPDGLTPEMGMKFTLHNMQLNGIGADESLAKSMVHQYTDWSDPKNPSRINDLLGGDLWSDFSFTVPATLALRAHAQSGTVTRTYMYFFEHRPSFALTPEFMKGANHMDEIPFVLGFPESFMAAVGAPNANVTEDEITLSTTMMKYWSQFAKTGNPNSASTEVLWPEYDSETEKYIIFNTGPTALTTGQYLRRRQVNYWTNVFPGLMEAMNNAHDNTNCYPTSEGTNIHPTIYLITAIMSTLCMLF